MTRHKRLRRKLNRIVRAPATRFPHLKKRMDQAKRTLGAKPKLQE